LTPDCIEIRNTNSESKLSSLEPEKLIMMHKTLEFSQLEPLFICVLTERNTAIGLRFLTTEEETIVIGHIKMLINKIKGNSILQDSSMTNNITKANDQTANIGDRPQAESGASKKFLYCLSLVNNQKNDTARRGAVVKAISICTRYPFIQIFKPAIVLALQRFYENSTEKVLAELYQALNAMDLSSMPAYNDYQKQILRANDDKSKLEFSTVINYVTKMNIKIPIALLPDEVGDCKLIPLVKKFGSQVMLIYNGLLTQKRILFLGFDSSAGELCEYVLAACSMLCPPLKGLIHRAFPYTNLTYLNFLEIPGYIAGVANPMFEMHMDWWDLLCNIKTGKITVNSSSSSSLTQQQLPSPLPSPTFPSSPSSPSSPSQQHVIEKYTQFDNEFIAQVSDEKRPVIVMLIFECYCK